MATRQPAAAGVLSVVCFLAMAVAVPPAHAELTPVAVEPGPRPSPPYLNRALIGGPALTRTGVVWARSERSGDFALEADDGNGARRLGTIGPALDVTVRAEGDRIAYGRYDWYAACRAGRCPRLLANEVFSGTLDSPFARLAGCHLGESGCGPRPQPAPSVRVTADAVAYRVGSASEIEVRNYDAGGPAAVRRFPGGPEFALAGRYLAAQSATGDTSTVYDRLTGAPIFTINSLGPYALDTDGTVAFAVWPGLGFAWASPADPSPHPVAAPRPTGTFGEGSSTALAMRNGTIVWTYDGGSKGTEMVFQQLHGDRILRLPPFSSRVGDFAFDGQRLVWAVQPCAVVWVARLQFDPAAWTTSTFPRTPAGRCGTAVASVPVRRATQSGGVMLSLTCPAAAVLGCTGGVGLSSGENSGRGLAVGSAPVLMPPDTTRRVRVQIRHRALARLRHDGRLVVDLISGAAGRQHDPSRRLRFVLLAQRG